MSTFLRSKDPKTHEKMRTSFASTSTVRTHRIQWKREKQRENILCTFAGDVDAFFCHFMWVPSQPNRATGPTIVVGNTVLRRYAAKYWDYMEKFLDRWNTKNEKAKGSNEKDEAVDVGRNEKR